MSINLKSKIEEYLSLKPSQFRVLKSVTLTQGVEEPSGVMEQHLSLVLASDAGFTGEMLYVELSGVRNLKLQQPDWSLITFSDLEIREAPSTGGFDRRYVVLDAEEGTITCSCDDFEACVA